MKSIRLILLATTVLVIASIAVGTTTQAQAKNIFNQHAHSDGLKGNDGSVTNCSGELCFDSTGSQVDKYHSNTNDNTNRPYDGECCADRVRTNSHDIPNKGGNSDKGD